VSSTLLIGHWSEGPSLTITESHQVEDGDQAAIDALTAPAFAAGSDWACEFPDHRHRHAVQLAYERYARDEDVELVDDVEGVEPDTD